MKRKKYKIVYVCGVPFKVEAKNALQIEKEERDRIRKEWNTNNLID